MQKMPISNVQWIDRSELSPNLYNPNKVAPPEMSLLKQSILQDGWLFPIIVVDKTINIKGLTDNDNLDKYTIIDGFHRFTISGRYNKAESTFLENLGVDVMGMTIKDLVDLYFEE
jgi:hypothetical protein